MWWGISLETQPLQLGAEDNDGDDEDDDDDDGGIQ